MASSSNWVERLDFRIFNPDSYLTDQHKRDIADLKAALDVFQRLGLSSQIWKDGQYHLNVPDEIHKISRVAFTRKHLPTLETMSEEEYDRVGRYFTDMTNFGSSDRYQMLRRQPTEGDLSDCIAKNRVPERIARALPDIVKVFRKTRIVAFNDAYDDVGLYGYLSGHDEWVEIARWGTDPGSVPRKPTDISNVLLARRMAAKSAKLASLKGVFLWGLAAWLIAQGAHYWGLVPILDELFPTAKIDVVVMALGGMPNMPMFVLSAGIIGGVFNLGKFASKRARAFAQVSGKFADFTWKSA